MAFVLHDSFDPIYKIYDANESKEVFTEVVAYEAFAVGAVYKPMHGNDYVYLELDLNNIPNVPNGFRWS